MISNSIIGNRYGRLTVLAEEADKYPSGQEYRKCICRCICGNSWVGAKYEITSGRAPSCGCLRKEKIGEIHRKHGLSNTKEYRTWLGMIDRCTNKKRSSYKNYGGKGIKVCKRWLKFENFLFDMKKAPTKKHSIDRVNNNGNYEPKNCHWATRSEQNYNTSRTLVFKYMGKKMKMNELILYSVVGYRTLKQRLYKGWSIENALKTPLQIQRGKNGGQ